ncbi:MAG: HAMP domain-containing protein [Elusimicrobia bacterium]|nr:HAMP domain-containing protein [Elusimicrobiota bacterium]
MNPLRSVAAKLSLLTSLFVLGVIALMSRGVLAQIERGLVGQMQVRAQFFARSAREALFPKLDPFSLNFHVQEAVKEKAVTYAAVVGPDGTVLSHSDPRLIGEKPDDPLSVRARAAKDVLLQRRTLADGAVAYEIDVPLTVGSHRLGTARLGFDQSSIREALAAQKRRLVELAALATAAAVLGTILIVGWITRPLPRLAAAAREIGRGRFDVRVDWRSDDEIGRLARAFNDMASANAVLFAAIRQEKEKLATIFEETREGMIWIDPAGRLLLINRSAKTLLGAGEKEPADLAAALAGFQAKPAPGELLAGAARITPLEFSRKEPKLLILSGVADRLGTPEEPAGLLLVFHDATVEKRGETLARSFLAIVSHKLRTPLAVALGYLEILQAEGDRLDEAQKAALDKIRREDEHLQSLVEKLIAFATVQSPEGIVLDKVPTRIVEVIDEAVRGVPALSGPGVALTWRREAAAALPELPADRALVRASVANLLENAVKFNRGQRKEVEVSVSAEGGGVRVSVRDNGPGIPSEERPKLFRKFYQIDDDFTGQVPGFGLGLAFVRNVAEAHGGAAGVRPAEGGGSEFWLVLPGAAPGPKEAPAGGAGRG